MIRRGQDQKFLDSGKDWRTEEGTGYLLGINMVFIPFQFREDWVKSQEPNIWVSHLGRSGFTESHMMFVWVGNISQYAQFPTSTHTTPHTDRHTPHHA